MGKGPGKEFEADFKNSVYPTWDYERFKDAGYNLREQKEDGFNDDKKKFTPKNICDCFIFNPNNGTLHYIENKSRKGKSISFKDVDKNGKTLNKMIKKTKKKNVNAWIVVNFRSVERTFALDVNKAKEYINQSLICRGRKSFPIAFFEESAIEIPALMKRTRYWYDLKVFIGG